MLVSTSSYAQRREALLINNSATDKIWPHYRNILHKDKGGPVKPGDTLRIQFDENSYLPTTVHFAREIHNLVEQPALLVLPGDVITIRHNEAAVTYDFTGRYPAELRFFEQLWRSSFSLSNWAFLDDKTTLEMPATLEEFMAHWQRLRLTGDSLRVAVRTTPGIRPAMAEALERELRLQKVAYLLGGVWYHNLYNTQPFIPRSVRLMRDTLKLNLVTSFPAVYQDSVRAQLRLLRSMQLLPPTASPKRLETLDRMAAYLTMLQNRPASTSVQYAVAKQEYTGLEREWVCYALLEEAQFMHRPIGTQLKDYRTWVMPESRFVRSLTHQDQFTLVMPNQQMATTDTLVAPDGSRQTLAALLARHRGKVIYLDLWASWCAPCIMEMPATAALHRHYQGKPVVVIQLSIDKDKQAWQQASKEFLAGVREQYHFVSPTTAGFLKRFTVNSIPRYVLLDKYGIVRYADALRPDDPELKPLIADLLAR
ncbi:TlpA family protein disulfide reductase [Hymenobacter aerilatus]|uniref:TlpA family protein disulfide reductase n=1 Tax=Hymenobacter aerilatus TaxID=2932251 RepID=A0A8T9T1N3_9BACT|nr:TlpA disulfide reductase family protein [Hymenobacter aerilatus]UOR07084.1 TlpA family protein disulfide reductase [Hymenobacter aerilatus]